MQMSFSEFLRKSVKYKKIVFYLMLLYSMVVLFKMRNLLNLSFSDELIESIIEKRDSKRKLVNLILYI